MPNLLAAAFGLALTTAYWPGIAGVATTPRWDVAALLSVVLFFSPPFRMTMTHWIGIALIAWLALSLLWNDGGADGLSDGVQELIQIAMIAVAFAVGSSMTDIRPLFIGAALGIGINSGFAIAQWMGWDGAEVILTRDGHFAGLFYERDRLASAAAMVAVGLVALPRAWRLLPLVLPSLILAPYKAALLAVAGGLLVMAGNKGRVVIAASVASIAGWFLFHGIDPSNAERLMIWQDTITNLTWFGHGLGSFREDFIRIAHAFDIAVQHTRPEHPHNELLWIDFEGGLPATALAALFAGGLWVHSEACPRLRGVLACVSVLALFAMPLHDPATAVLFTLCAGHVVGCDARLRDGFVSRRGALRASMAAN